MKHDYNNERKQRDFLMDGHVGEENLITLPAAHERNKCFQPSLISVEKSLIQSFRVYNETDIKQQRA